MRTKSIKKILVTILAIAIAFAFTACGSGTSEGGSSSSPKSPAVTADNLNIEDFDWKVEKAAINGQKCYALKITNNSKYDLYGIQIDYCPKDKESKELSTFDGFMKDHSDFIDEGQTTAEVMLRGFKEDYVPIGSTSANAPLTIGIGELSWYDIPSDEQFELMKPEELMIGIVNKDVLYIAYYEFESESWIIDDSTREVNNWPDSELASSIPKPESSFLIADEYESIDSMSADVYGTGKDGYDAYVNQAKEAGFKDDDSSDTYFSGEREDGSEITVDYDETTDSYHISADGADE
ncbi:MAG: hypothetical protein HUJ76_02950 [Parasporobacterium sp.]|nr:hypothetical protein [Parasporobacterium sp.]